MNKHPITPEHAAIYASDHHEKDMRQLRDRYMKMRYAINNFYHEHSYILNFKTGDWLTDPLRELDTWYGFMVHLKSMIYETGKTDLGRYLDEFYKRWGIDR